MKTAQVLYQGMEIGAVAWEPVQQLGYFEYTAEFIRSGIQLSPLVMPARQRGEVFSFPALNKASFFGLPGMLADALPDKFGNAVIDAWLARQGRDRASFSPVERLCYIGKRGMGALEFKPATQDKGLNVSTTLDVDELVSLAQTITRNRSGLATNISGTDTSEAIMDIIRVGTSAGGARPKAIIALNAKGEVRSGQVSVPPGFEHWLIKFDGVTDMELGEPQQYGRVEYAYYLMAKAFGIDMMESRLLEEGGRAHFLTRRFDRNGNNKIHAQTLCGLAHYDYNMAGAYSYEQAFQVMRALGLSKPEAEQLFRRMLFNVVFRNQDDHTKNISFLMDSSGQWRLSPAYDLIYAHNPAGQWTNQHQMSINGKRDEFSYQDIQTVADNIGLKNYRELIDQITEVTALWPEFADQAALSQMRIEEVKSGFRHALLELR
ncbi:MAG: type II toxin-antitoxin system HipA family toxin [Pseudomonadales bacterium]|nr:type II toxin-antitoxin system HipA family toxin [Pseudomonadales bacterium]MCP5171793.1 type II toxin-antitoxin system HipA family toxin [Pseudomonadales bacterium]